MPNVFDGTNPITDILGDEPTEREVTMENQSTMTIIEPLTNTQIPAGQTVLVRVIGDMAHETLVNNIQQINALQGFEVIGVTSVVIPDVPNAGLRFVPTGAVESVDGEYQRFTYDGTHTASIVYEGVTYVFPTWYADIPEPARRGPVFQIAFKLPQGSVDLYIATANFSDVFSAEGRPFNHIALELRSEDMQGAPSSGISVIDHATPANSVYASLDPMPAGSLIVLNVSDVSIDYVSPFGSGSLPIPVDFFSNAPNVIAHALGESTENVAVLSVKISVAE